MIARDGIRPARDDDLAALAALVNGAYRGDTARAGWTHEADLLGGQRTDTDALRALLAADNGAALLMREDMAGEPLAVVLVEASLDAEAASTVGIGMLTVRPDRQACGLGAAMLDAAERWALAHGATRTTMTVIGLRAALIEWYGRRGYRPVGHAPFPYDDRRCGISFRRDLDFVVLAKALMPDV